MSDRATCWSITINNPTKEDLNPDFPAGWKMTGQVEEGKLGTEHYQGMLTTPQVRLSAVKKVLKRAHIEAARNRKALEKYVHKEETRVGTVADKTSDIPTLFEYQTIVASLWDDDEFEELVQVPSNKLTSENELAMRYVDRLVAYDIETNGRRGAEFIGINPMWRSSWKLFYRSIIIRRDAAQNQVKHQTSGTQNAEASPPSSNAHGSSESPADVTAS